MNGTVVVTTRGDLVALDVDGEERWSAPLQYGEFAPTIAGDRVVVTDRWRAYCFDAAEGHELWRRKAGERSRSDVIYTGFEAGPVVSGGVVFLPSSGGDLYAVQ